jgi:ABC-type hemin transport system substrate-binding protein
MQKELRRIFKCFTAVRLAQSNAVANANIQHVDVNFSTVYGPNTPNMMVTRMTEK